MERVERGEDAEIESSALTDLTRVGEVASPWAPEQERGRPAEPAREAPERTQADGKRVLQELRAFYLQGERPAPDGGGGEALPALLHPYRDLARLRHEFPVLLDGANPATSVQPLSAVIDGAIAAAATPDDAGEKLRHAVLRLESVMRTLVADHGGDRLSLVWDRAAATLFETTRLPDDKAAAMRAAIARTRKEISSDAELLACGPDAPARIFAACASAFWNERCAPWRGELAALILQMENILAADFDRSDEAMRPERMRETLGGTTDVDALALSSLLRSAPHGARLPEGRRARVRETIATLKAMQPAFSAHAGERARASICMDTVLSDVAGARAEQSRRMQALTAFFKAVRIARLEIQNQYREVHDAYFAQFCEHHLTVDELALVPPVLVRIGDDDLARGGSGDLMAALDSSAAIKVLLELRSVYDVRGDAARPDVVVGWPAHLAAITPGLSNAYVMQAPASRAVLLRERMLAGMRAAGPALFSVGIPASREGGLAPYLGASAAAESRLLPVIVFDPARGATLAERLDITDNPQVERTWPVERFAFRDADGHETAVDLAFTPADFLFSDPRLAGHFWSAPAGWWHDAMLPLHEILELPASEAAGRIPYILTVDGENRVGRVVVSRALVGFSRRCRTFWLGLREMGGVENSFAARALAAERERLVVEKEREIDEIEKNYVAQLEQDIGELTREIVQRIAAQLLGAGAAPAVPAPAATSAPRGQTPPAPAVEAATAALAPAAEEERIVIDDAYIDTPLCTSCNECTQLNPRVFAYNANKQAEIKDAAAGTFSDMVRAAELCPVHIIHPGKPKNASEPGLDEWVKRAQRYN